MTNPFNTDTSHSDGPKKVVAADGHEYHKSATANASVAPTNEHTIKNATKQGKMDAEELNFVTLFQYEWGVRGKLPSLEVLKSEYQYTEDEVMAYLSSAYVQQALQERGLELTNRLLGDIGLVLYKGKVVPLQEEDPESLLKVRGARTAPKLTPLQLIVANTMLDLLDTRSDKKKLQDLGVTTAQYQMWLRNEAFREYLTLRAEGLLGDAQHEAMLSLMDRVRSGDTNAIKYYHQLTGRFVEEKASNSGGSQQIHDLQQIIVRIIEIVTEEVDDPATGARISDKLKGLVAGNQVAGILPSNNEIVVPEIAKPREMTPQMRKLMEAGVGMND